MPALVLLLPSWLDLAGWAGVALASLAMCGIGRLVTWGRAAPESALLAGWGVVVLVLTGLVLGVVFLIRAIFQPAPATGG